MRFAGIESFWNCPRSLRSCEGGPSQEKQKKNHVGSVCTSSAAGKPIGNTFSSRPRPFFRARFHNRVLAMRSADHPFPRSSPRALRSCNCRRATRIWRSKLLKRRPKSTFPLTPFSAGLVDRNFGNICGSDAVLFWQHHFLGADTQRQVRQLRCAAGAQLLHIRIVSARFAENASHDRQPRVLIEALLCCWKRESGIRWDAVMAGGHRWGDW